MNGRFNPKGRGGCSTPPYQKSALKPSKWPPNDPKFRVFFLFLYDLSEKQKKFFWFFTVFLGDLEGAC